MEEKKFVKIGEEYFKESDRESLQKIKLKIKYDQQREQFLNLEDEINQLSDYLASNEPEGEVQIITEEWEENERKYNAALKKRDELENELRELEEKYPDIVKNRKLGEIAMKYVAAVEKQKSKEN